MFGVEKIPVGIDVIKGVECLDVAARRAGLLMARACADFLRRYGTAEAYAKKQRARRRIKSNEMRKRWVHRQRKRG